MLSLSLIAPWAVVLLVVAGAVTLFARRSALGDSPWYWVAIFSMSAAAALFVMDGKYQRRQDHLENEYRYGTRSLSSDSQANPQAEAESQPASNTRLPTSVRLDSPQADPGSTELTAGRPLNPDRLISLWPLRIAAIAATLVSIAVLICRKPQRASRSSTTIETQS